MSGESFIEKLSIRTIFFNYASKATIEREENISRLISIFPSHKNDILKNIRIIEIKTYGLKWCYEYALSGKTWAEIKNLINKRW